MLTKLLAVVSRAGGDEVIATVGMYSIRGELIGLLWSIMELDSEDGLRSGEERISVFKWSVMTVLLWWLLLMAIGGRSRLSEGASEDKTGDSWSLSRTGRFVVFASSVTETCQEPHRESVCDIKDEFFFSWKAYARRFTMQERDRLFFMFFSHLSST